MTAPGTSFSARAENVIVVSPTIGVPKLVASRGAASTELTQELVRELIDYDPATGALTHRWRDRRWFGTDRACNIWNARFLAHRVIFLLMTGRWPEPEIDHDNHDPGDNRWHNLVEATHQQNLRNQVMRNTNTSGHTGVYPCGNRFAASIHVSGRKLNLGTFESFEDACAARKAAEREYGFHEHHGEERAA
jgi:hypothetical protein